MIRKRYENTLTTIVIPTLDQWEYTSQCLDSIRAFTVTPYELIVVDNGSMDETVTSLKQMKDVILIENGHNKGFPAACNQGLAIARGDQFLLLNNDVVTTHGWLERMLDCLHADPAHGAVGPVSNSVSGVQARPQPYQTLEQYHEISKALSLSTPAKFIYSLRLVGFCLLIRREVYEAIGPLDEQFGKGTFEDDDYCMRIRRAGYKLVIATDAYIHHFGSMTNRLDAEYSQLLADNQRKFQEKWGVDPSYSTWMQEDLAALVPQVDRALDVGCACGGLGLTLKNSGISFVAGIEVDHMAAVDAQTVLDQVWIGDATKMHLPYPHAWFDAMVFADVLEHFADPLQALRHLLPYLKENGYVIASIHNVGHAAVLHGLVQGAWTYQDAGVLDRTHLRFFTLLEIARMFEQAGLLIEFVGMVQDSTPELDRFIHGLDSAVSGLGMQSYGPNFAERCRTVQYYIRAQKHGVP